MSDSYNSFQAIYTAKKYMQTSKGPYCLLVKRQTFLPYKLQPPDARLITALRFSTSRKNSLELIELSSHSRFL
jgi:hypothetical protein